MDRSLPPFLRQQLGDLLLWQWLGIGVCLIVGVVLGLLTASFLHRLLEKVVRRTPVRWDDPLARALKPPSQAFMSLVVTYVCIKSSVSLPKDMQTSLAALTRASVIGVTIWGVIRSLHAIGHAFADDSFTRETMDPLRQASARGVRTQIILATRVLSVLVFTLGIAFVALQFEVVRSVGMSLLASAGVAGVALGFAAQKSLGALLAGIQISISQPIRIGDSVLLQGEFGTIEDIGLTFVTVKLWDERRMIVPTPRFLEEPFQNWSRTRIGLTGFVLLKCDFSAPIDALRTYFETLMDAEPLWDGRIKKLQVFDAIEGSVELRLLISARDPGTLADLRVSVREKMLSWLQTHEHGAYVPRARVLMTESARYAPLRPDSIKPVR